MAVLNPIFLEKKLYTAKMVRALLAEALTEVPGVPERILDNASLVASAAGGLGTSVAAGRCVVKGDTNADQGSYLCVNDSAFPLTHSQDATNPKIDRIVMQVNDSSETGSGPDSGTIAIIAGTPTSGANLTNNNGLAALPPSAMPIARVRVPASPGSITAADIADDRPRTAGKSISPAERSRTNAAYGLLQAGEDVVSGVTLPQDGLMFIAFQGLWKESVSGASRAAIFIGPNQLKAQVGTAPIVQEASNEAVSANQYHPLFTSRAGLHGGGESAAYGSDVTTGQILGGLDDTTFREGQLLVVFAAQGTYDVSVQFKASSGSVTAKERKLWVWTMGF